MPAVSIWAKLQSQTQPGWVVEFPTYRPKSVPITIGRNPSCTLPLPDNLTISNRHVLLECRDLANGQRAVVLHESSSNGTEVDGKLYSKGAKVPLAPNSTVVFPVEEGRHAKSDYTFVFTVLEEEAAVVPREEEEEEDASLLLAQELHAIQLQCDSLAIAASRLCAASTMKPATDEDDDLAAVAVGMLQALRRAQARLRELSTGNEEDDDVCQVHQWEAALDRLGVKNPECN